jgi:hypothetical protein
MQILRAGMVILGLTVGLGQIAGAQQTGELAQAPLPTQLLAAKKVFLSNGPGEGLVPRGEAEAAYNLSYAGMKSWGAYELVGAPADADLVFEFRYSLLVGGGISQYFRLVILDPKTHVVLWSLGEAVEPANMASTARKNFARAITELVNDVKRLVGAPVAAGDAVKK